MQHSSATNLNILVMHTKFIHHTHKKQFTSNENVLELRVNGYNTES